MIRAFVISLVCMLFSVQSVKAIWAVTDLSTTKQQIASAYSCAQSLHQTIQGNGHRREMLSYIENVNRTIRDIKVYKDICTRQVRLTDNCIKLLKDVKETDLAYMCQVSTTLLAITQNNTALYLMTERILTDDFKMNDAGRIDVLKNCQLELAEMEAQLVLISRMLSYTRQIKQNCESIKKFK